MQVATYYLLKVFLSCVFMFLIAFSLRELYRLWFVPRITLAPFAYQKDGTASEGQGTAFSQRVYQELRGIQRSMKGDKQTAPQSQPEPAPALSPGQATTLVPLPFVPDMGINLKIPEIQKLPLAGLELKVQGVDFASLARSISQWADPPDQFAGSVVEASPASFNTLVEWHRFGRTSTDMQLAADNHATLDDAAFATACNILYLLLLEQDKKFDAKLSRSEFEVFARSLRHYSIYRTAVTEWRPKAVTDKAQTSLEEADRLADGLIQQQAGERFSKVYMLAAITAAAKSDPRRAHRHLAIYREKHPNDKQAEELAKQIPRPAEQAVAATKMQDAPPPKKKYRPVQPGISVASRQSGAGTLCCLVEHRTTKTRYWLSSEHVFSGETGSCIIQPSPLDGGSGSRDLIGHLFQAISPKEKQENRMAGALATLVADIPVDPKCFAIGAFQGKGTVAVGDEVTLVGRTSGVSKGKVIEVNGVATIHDTAQKPLTFSGLIICQNAGGGSFSQSGDSGAPVVNKQNQLIGMLYAASQDRSIVIPIQAIFDAFEVELVDR